MKRLKCILGSFCDYLNHNQNNEQLWVFCNNTSVNALPLNYVKSENTNTDKKELLLKFVKIDKWSCPMALYQSRYRCWYGSYIHIPEVNKLRLWKWQKKCQSYQLPWLCYSFNQWVSISKLYIDRLKYKAYVGRSQIVYVRSAIWICEKHAKLNVLWGTCGLNFRWFV